MAIVDGVNEYYWIGTIEADSAILQSGAGCVGDVGYTPLRGFEAVYIHKCVGNLTSREARSIHGDDLLIDRRDVLLALLHHLRLKAGLPYLKALPTPGFR